MTNRLQAALLFRFAAPLLLGLAACGEGGEVAYNQTSSLGSVKPFSSAIDPGAPAALLYGDRLGPNSARWTDSFVGVNAPSVSGKVAPDALASLTHGPELLVGSLALYLEGGAAPTATVARDLETGQEKWRLTGTGSFLPAQVTADGSTACGVAVQASPGYSSADIQCVELATGNVKWRKTLPRWLTMGPGYGQLAELVIRGNALYVLGGRKLTVHALSDGSELWSLDMLQHTRGLVFEGNDLLLEGVTANCAADSSCLRAVNPDTGATVAEFAAPSASHLWSQAGVATYLIPSTGPTRSTVSYDSSTHQFTEDSALAESFAKASLPSALALVGVTPVLPTGKVFLLSVDGTGLNQPVSGAALCRYSVKARSMDWCSARTQLPAKIRVHPNVLFLYMSTDYAAAELILPPEPEERATVSDFRFYFGKWGFNRGDFYAYR